MIFSLKVYVFLNFFAPAARFPPTWSAKVCGPLKVGVPTGSWIVTFAKISKLIKMYLKTLQKCPEMVRKRSDNRP